MCQQTGEPLIAFHLFNQFVLLHDLLRHHHVEILNQLSLVRNDSPMDQISLQNALSVLLRIMEALDDVPSVLHFLLRGSKHAVRDIDRRGVNQRLAIKTELLSLEIACNDHHNLQALLLESLQVLHVQIHAIENNWAEFNHANVPLLYFLAARITSWSDVISARRECTFSSFDRSLVPMMMHALRGRQPQISSAFRIPRGVSIRLQISYYEIQTKRSPSSDSLHIRA